MPNHTPGPWTFEDGNNYCCEINIGETTANITRDDKNTGKYVIERSEMEANAKLIAAAPDLLEALERLLLTSSAAIDPGKNDIFTKQFFKARDKAALAINKATN